MLDTPMGVTDMDFEEANKASQSTFGGTPLKGSVLPCEVVEKKAIEVTVMDPLGRALGDYGLELSQGSTVYRLRSNPFGAVRFEGLDAASYPLTLLGVDGRAWDCREVQPLPLERLRSNQPAAWGVPEPIPLGGGAYSVKPGEGVDKIALRVGHLPETLWNDPANQNLRNARKGRNLLAPNDPLYIPPRQQVSLDASVGYHYVLRLSGGMSRLRLRLAVGFEPQDGVAYLLEIPDAPSQSDTTKNGGYIDTWVPTQTTRVTLVLQGGNLRIDLPIDTLLPLGDDRGVQQRLRNLGYPCAATDGTFDDAAKAVLHRFQDGVSLPRSDTLDDNVRKTLFALHDRG
ncbi:peptidoglycan-binding domain-containing protein [Pyxidicoccus sp. 3LG]